MWARFFTQLSCEEWTVTVEASKCKNETKKTNKLQAWHESQMLIIAFNFNWKKDIKMMLMWFLLPHIITSCSDNMMRHFYIKTCSWKDVWHVFTSLFSSSFWLAVQIDFSFINILSVSLVFLDFSFVSLRVKLNFCFHIWCRCTLLLLLLLLLLIMVKETDNHDWIGSPVRTCCAVDRQKDKSDTVRHRFQSSEKCWRSSFHPASLLLCHGSILMNRGLPGSL